MINRLFTPLAVSVFGLLLGGAVGLGWFWIRAEFIVAGVLARPRVSAHAAEKTKGWDFWTIEIDSLASELKDEKARIRKESEQLDLRAARLASDRQDLDKLRMDLNAMRKDIGDRVVEIQADEAKNLRMLAQTYSSLSPQGAVAIIREMDDSTAVKILSLMKPDVVGPIFEAMAQSSSPGSNDARRAALLSDKLRLLQSQKTAQTP